MENTTREHQRYFVWVCWKDGNDAAEIHRMLVNAEGDKALSKRTIYRWIEAFDLGQSTIQDAPRSGRPRDAVLPSNVNIIEDLIKDDPHITVRELQEIVPIGLARIDIILHSELALRKVCAKFVPHALTDENKQKRVELSKELLEYLESGFNNIITGDETWFHFYTMKSKTANKVWVKPGDSRPQIPRTVQNSKKRMFCVFFSVDGIVTTIVVDKGKTVTGDFYKSDVLPKVFKKFREIKNRSTLRNVMLHHDNASPHKAKAVTEYLKEQRITALPHPPYSPDLAPCDFFLFPRIKKELGGKRFESVEELKRAVKAIANDISKEDYTKCFENWCTRLKRCIEVGGEYFEGME